MASIFDKLTTQWLKDNHVLGVDLTLDDKSPFPESVFTDQIRSAAAWLQQEVGIVLDIVEVEAERHDAVDRDKIGFWPLRLDRRPVVDISAVRLRYGASEIATLPADWVNLLNKIHGQLHLIPSSSTLGTFVFSGSIPYLHGHWGGADYLPGYIEIDYRAGFPSWSGTFTATDQIVVEIALDPTAIANDYEVDAKVTAGEDVDLETVKVEVVSRKGAKLKLRLSAVPKAQVTVTWRATCVPSDIVHAIGLRASMLALDVAGDLIAGAGIANFSTSLDGASQSIGTTSSATNAGYGARVLQFEKELKPLLNAIKARYRMPGILCV